MTNDQLDHANLLRYRIQTLEQALTEWEKHEDPIEPSGVRISQRYFEKPPEDRGLTLSDRDAWAIYRRACIKHIAAQIEAAKRELQLL